LTSNYKIILRHDHLAAAIYQDRQLYSFSVQEISELRGITPSDIRKKYKDAKDIIKLPDEAWLYGLSSRAKKAILEHTKYVSKQKLRNDIINGIIDLETLPNVGHKVACEVLRWCALNN